jgi:serine phosphatase RsbU (regulator of sigma subunit)
MVQLETITATDRVGNADAATRPGFLLPGLMIAMAVMALVVVPVFAQKGLPDPVVLGPSLSERLWITDGWRYHPGDDPGWADPGFDDSSWPTVSSALFEPEALPGGWPGMGWFRRRVMLADGMPTTALALRVEQRGASEVYLDGRLMVTAGTVSNDPAVERPVYPNDFGGVAFEAGSVHILAVRYSNARGNVFPSGAHGFHVNLRSVESAANAYHGWTLMVTVRQMMSAGAFAALSLLHLLLFAFHRRDRSNIVIALFTALITAQLVLGSGYELTTDLLERLEIYRFLVGAFVAVTLSGLAVEHVIFRRRPQPSTWLVGIAGVAFCVWVWTWDAFRTGDALTIFLLAGSIEMLRVAISAMIRRDPDAWIVALGFVPLAGRPILNMVASTAVPGFFYIPFSLGLLPLVLCFSVYRSRRAARTSRELETNLEEIKRLSERAIEQERKAVHDEAERLLLAAENKRRAEELEAARRLQLAMLPSKPPEIEGLEVFFRMVTATEVGGDYVDIRSDGGGRALMAVGDATSHGLHAGMVVAAVKSMFQAVDLMEPPAQILARIGAELEAMRERYASMAMAVLQIERDRFRIASAGMPPLLLLRKESGEVEEVLLAAPPLGTVAGITYHELTVDIACGDTVLVMTDGLVEAVNSEGELFGYGRAAKHLATLTDRSAGEVVDGMLEAVEEFLAGIAPQDDITLVAMQSVESTD